MRLAFASKQQALDALARHLGMFDKPDPLANLAEDLRAARLRVYAEADAGRRLER